MNPAPISKECSIWIPAQDPWSWKIPLGFSHCACSNSQWLPWEQGWFGCSRLRTKQEKGRKNRTPNPAPFPFCIFPAPPIPAPLPGAGTWMSRGLQILGKEFDKYGNCCSSGRTEMGRGWNEGLNLSKHLEKSWRKHGWKKLGKRDQGRIS